MPLPNLCPGLHGDVSGDILDSFRDPCKDCKDADCAMRVFGPAETQRGATSVVQPLKETTLEHLPELPSTFCDDTY
jgi:hypothetical protein